MNLQEFLNEHPFMSNKEIANRYNISESAACKKRKKMISLYELDDKRFPRDASIPTWVVIDYFDNNGKKLDKKLQGNANKQKKKDA